MASNGDYRQAAASDSIDIADVARTLRRQWRGVAGGVAIGVLAAVAVILFAPRRFTGTASVYTRPGTQASSSVSGRIGGLGDLLGGLGGLGLTGTLETELEVMKSRLLAGMLVDSLQLQIRVRSPEGTAPLALVTASSLPGPFKARTYDFQRVAAGRYRTERDGKTYDLKQGSPGVLDIGTVTLGEGELPAAFRLKIMDHEEAIDRSQSRLTATKAGGDIAKVVYSADDSVTAASAANLLIKYYLDRRKTTDRGVNVRRVEYVTAQLDSTGAELSRTERDLRKYQEATRVLDASVVGEVQLKASADMRQSLTLLQVDEAAINQMLAQAASGKITSRDLAANPAFVRGSAMSPMINQLSDLEAQRIRLLDRRTERDPDVKALDSTMRMVQTNIVGMTRSYAAALTKQREQMQSQLDSIQAQLLALPAAAEKGGRLERDVKRLTQIYTALGAQLVEARLGEIGEGGEARQIDVAVAQRKPSFPLAGLTLGIGAAGGLLCGVIAAMLLGWFGRWLRDPMEIERALGVTAQRYSADSPLLVAGAAGARSMLVVPLDSRAVAGAALVAEQLARTARQRVASAGVLDLSASHASGNGKSAESNAGALIEQMEQQNMFTIVRLPDLVSDTTLAVLRESRPVLLVAPPGRVDRARLRRAVESLRRLQVPCAGVVISDRPGTRVLA